MSDAMFDLLYIMDIVVRVVMMLTIIWGIVYWLKGPRKGMY